MKAPIPKRLQALLAGAALFPAGAWALPPLTGQPAPQSETIKYDAGKAATLEGAAALHARLREAADRVCTDSVAPSSGLREHAACVQASLDQAVGAVRIPMLTVVHQLGGRIDGSSVARR